MITKEKDVPLLVSRFKGLYKRGMSDSVPEFYQDSANNVTIHDDEISTRAGSESLLTKPNIRRFFTYKRLNETPRFLFLTTSGEFYDSLHIATPLITNVAFTDFSAINHNNRAYISFHNRTTGITGSSIYVYQGAGPGTLRFAAGTAPSSFTIGAADSASSGDIEAGIHIIALAFESDSGFISAPGPANFTIHTAAGGKKLDLSALATGPSGTVARRVLISASIDPADYDGNQFGFELFFAPGGRIGNNVDTTVTLDFFDNELVDSAEFLYDSLSLIPAGVNLGIHNNRMVVVGVSGQEHIALISENGYPEVFNGINGFITVYPSDAEANLTNSVEFRNSLILTKPNHSYITSDNGSAPNTWKVDRLDDGAGTSWSGISVIRNNKGANTDRFFIADSSGLMVFEAGVFKRPVLSKNIEDIWLSINKLHFNKVQVTHDSENLMIYVAAPLEAATEISHILVGNYNDAFSPIGFLIPDNIKWSIWTLPSTVSCIVVDTDVNDVISKLRFSYLSGNIYQFEEDLLSDDGTAIDWDWTTHLLAPDIRTINHFLLIVARAIGIGNIDIDLFGQDEAETIAIPDAWTLSTIAGKNMSKKIDFQNERMKIKFSQTGTVGEWATFKHVSTIAKILWEIRPDE